jgi:8-oxo-dGTP pyrophosphatase MutT (NUDIX family)
MPSLRTLAFQSWFRLSRPMTLGVRGAVERADGRVFMVRHTYVNGWFLPGGGVEHGEPTIEALRRELLEEAGVRLITDPPVVGIYSNHQNFRNDHVLLYRVPWGSWEQEKATSVGEIAETAWVDPLAPIKGATKGTLQRFDELYRGAAQSPYWVDPTR